jgi:DNA primase
MKIDNNLINEIRNNIDIVDVISGYLPLSSKGKNYFGVCPFHDDKNPSMSVSRERQIYTCFSCGASGNVFKFISDYENISFLDAVKKCADMAGISIDIGQAKKIPNKYQNLYNIFNLSNKFYINNINSSVGKQALDYLHNRGLNDETIKEFEIGLSLNEHDKLTKLLKSKNYSDQDLISTGLVNENNLDLHDVYRNRIMFPLCDLSGQVIGYNGRVYHGETENKYINPKETVLFKKRELLYNYFRAKEECRKAKSVIVMEGPMDTIRAYTVGIKNVVATLGTAITPQHAILLRKLSNNVILCFDGDAAGLKATKSAIIELNKVGISPSIVRLEDNADPDEYILKRGKEAFLSKINNPLNEIEFKELEFKKNIDFSKKEDLANYTNLMLENISKMDDDILKEISLTRLSEDTKIDINFLREKIKKNEPTIEHIKIPLNTNHKLTKYEKSERNLVYYMLRYPEVIQAYDKKGTHMPDEKYRHLAFQISYFYSKYGYINIADLITELRDDQQSIKTIGELDNLSICENYQEGEIDDYLDNIRKYNEKSQTDIYKNKLKNEVDLQTKLEIAKKALEYKLRSEENGR